MQIESNRHLAETLTSKGYAVHYSEYEGGHSFLNWSEGMANALQYVFGSENSTNAAESRK
jgi:enterochelin esterase-like enzyme